MNEKGSNPKKHTVKEDENEGKRLGCWAKLKSLFDERGFDLQYEYNDRQTITILGENPNKNEGYRRMDDRNSVIKKEEDNIVNIDGDLSEVINFYEQFATLNDDTKEDADIWKKSTLRHRVSVRPSMLLTNIVEETSTGDLEVDDVEEVIILLLILARVSQMGMSEIDQ